MTRLKLDVLLDARAQHTVTVDCQEVLDVLEELKEASLVEYKMHGNFATASLTLEGRHFMVNLLAQLCDE